MPLIVVKRPQIAYRPEELIYNITCTYVKAPVRHLHFAPNISWNYSQPEFLSKNLKNSN